MPIQYFTKEQLQRANAEAIKRKFNRTLDKKFIASLNADDKYPILDTFGDESYVRVHIVVNAKGDTVWLDVPYELYNRLGAVDADMPHVH